LYSILLGITLVGFTCFAEVSLYTENLGLLGRYLQTMLYMLLVSHGVIWLCFLITLIYSWEAENGLKKRNILESFRPIIIHVGYRQHQGFSTTVSWFHVRWPKTIKCMKPRDVKPEHSRRMAVPCILYVVAQPNTIQCLAAHWIM